MNNIHDMRRKRGEIWDRVPLPTPTKPYLR